MQGVADFIQWCIDNLNYETITLLMAIESSFIPFPSEIVVAPAAWKAATSSELNIFLIILFSTIGANIGALINYFLAYFLGRPLVYKFANSRLGKLCLMNKEKVEHAEKYFDNHGAISTIVGRLIPAIRQLISIPAGLAKMNIWKFILYTTLGAGLWNSILAAIGYSLASVPGIQTQEQLINKVSQSSHIIGLIIFSLVAIGTIIIVLHNRKNEKKN